MNNYFIRKSKFILTAVTVIILFSMILPVCYADESEKTDENIIFFTDFERSSDTEQWVPFGENVKLEKDSSLSHGGGYSLKAFNRVKSYDGPAIVLNSFTEPDTPYEITLWCSYTGEDNDSIKISLKNTFSGNETYDTVTETTNISPNTWIKITAEFIVSADSDEAVLYIESQKSGNIIWIDDIVIRTCSSSSFHIPNVLSPDGTTVFDFELIPAGVRKYHHSVIQCSDTLALHGDRSLCVKGRNSNDDGMQVILDNLDTEKDYRCSTAVAFGEKTDESFAMHLKYYLGSQFYSIPLEEGRTSDRGNWSVLSGTFRIPYGAENPCITISTVRPGDKSSQTYSSFYVDDFTISDELKTAQDIAMEKKLTRIWTIVLILVLFAGVLMALLLKKYINSEQKIQKAVTDSMTGALNRNAYEEKLIYLEQHAEKCCNIHLAVCDLNNLKDTNDNFGHKAGDECIRRCADILLTVAGSTGGKVYRTGGDEFVCISSTPFKTELENAISSAEAEEYKYPFSIAAGFTSYDRISDGEKPDIKKMLARCDRKMYLNKTEKKLNKN